MFKLFGKKSVNKAERRAHEFARVCNVYCCPETNVAIVASVLNHGVLTAEKSGGASAVRLSDAVSLNAAVCAALDSCEYEKDFNYFHTKKSDWPAYLVSGLKTVRSFEASFIRMSVRGVNSKNLFYGVTTPAFGEQGLKLATTVNANAADHGAALQYLVRNFLVCKAAIAS